MDQDTSPTDRLLLALTKGDAGASEDLLPFVYEELRRIAARLLNAAAPGQTLQPTELIHEAYLRLHGDRIEGFDGRVHFTRVAARAMRYVLVDRARARMRDKRGGGRGKVTLDTRLAVVADDPEELLFVHEGLDRLAEFQGQLAQIVELRFFGGMTVDEIAQALEISTSTVDRGWRTARAWWITEFGEAGA